MAERGVEVDHSTIARWALHFSPILNDLIRREMRRPNRSWRVDETYVRVAGRWTYLYRAIDSAGDTIDFLLSPNRDLTAAKGFLQLALSAAPVRPPARHQCRWPRGIRNGDCRTEGLGRTESEMPLPTISLPQQHH